VLKAMGVPSELALGTVRFSLSLYTKPAEIEMAIDAIVSAVDELRALSPFWEGAAVPDGAVVADGAPQGREPAWPS
jgi:cysteine desulfurase